MRFKRRMGPRRARRQTDWIAFNEENDQQSFVNNVIIYALVDQNDMTQKDGHLTVERVVGDFYMVCQDTLGAPTQCWAYVGIILSDLDNAGNVTAFSPRTGVDAEAFWLYKHLWLSDVSTTANFAFGYQQVQHLDVHVKRKMEDRQNLLLVFSAGAVAGGQIPTDALITFQLRTLVKLT